MFQKTITMKKVKETKNTYRFEEQPQPGQPAIIGTIYVQQWAIDATVDKLTVIIQSEDHQ